MLRLVITDLDGTLLDSRYSFDAARNALDSVAKCQLPLVICSSKTKDEILHYRKKLGNTDPFIAENGAVVYVPKGYFSFEAGPLEGEFETIVIGEKKERYFPVVEAIRAAGLGIKLVDEMTAQEFSEDSRLSLEEAKLAKQRFYELTFRRNPFDDAEIRKIADKFGVNYIWGAKYGHLTKADKGQAVKKLLKQFFRQNPSEKAISLGLGDSRNDFEMLKVVDLPFLVQREDLTFASDDFGKALGIGPEGWNQIVLSFVAGELDDFR